MSTQNDGGPAFPEPMAYHPQRERMSFCQEEGGATGMTLRDWFAGQAMSGELAAQSPQTGEWAQENFPALAQRSYLIADAMLAARKKDL